MVGIDRPVSEAPSMEISSLLPPTVPVPSRAVSKRSNGARNVVPRVAGVEFVADSTLVDPESGERALESAVHAARSVSEDVHGALEFNLWTPRDSEDGAVLQGIHEGCHSVPQLLLNLEKSAWLTFLPG